MLIEGHFEGTRAKHYTSREWENLRPVYTKAFPHIDLEGANVELEKKLLSWQDEKAELERRLTEKDMELKTLKAETVSKADFEKRMDEMTQFMWRELGKRIGGKIGAQKETPEPSGQAVREGRNKKEAEKKPSK
jgi:hypothetical protein